MGWSFHHLMTPKYTLPPVAGQPTPENWPSDRSLSWLSDSDPWMSQMPYTYKLFTTSIGAGAVPALSENRIRHLLSWIYRYENTEIDLLAVILKFQKKLCLVIEQVK